MWKPFEFQGYGDVIKQLGKEGFRGMYKGNLTGILHLGMNGKLRSELYEKVVNMNGGSKVKEEKDFVK